MNDKQVAPKTARLAALAPLFSDPNLIAGTEHHAPPVATGAWTIPYVEYGPAVTDLQDFAYEDHWVRSDFDWPDWLDTPEAQSLVSDGESIERATTDQIARLLTVIMRRERFAEGSILNAIQSGLIRRLLWRIHAIDLANEGTTE